MRQTRGAEGLTLVEVMVSLVVLTLAVNAAFLGIHVTQRMHQQTIEQVEGAQHLKDMMARLSGYPVPEEKSGDLIDYVTTNGMDAEAFRELYASDTYAYDVFYIASSGWLSGQSLQPDMLQDAKLLSTGDTAKREEQFVQMLTEQMLRVTLTYSVAFALPETTSLAPTLMVGVVTQKGETVWDAVHLLWY